MSQTVRNEIDSLIQELRDGLVIKIRPICTDRWGPNWVSQKLPDYLASEYSVSGRGNDPLQDPLVVFRFIQRAWKGVFERRWDIHIKNQMQFFCDLRNDMVHHNMPIDEHRLFRALGTASLVMRAVGDELRAKHFDGCLSKLKESFYPGQAPLFPDGTPADANLVNDLPQDELNSGKSTVLSAKETVLKDFDQRQRIAIRQRNKSGFRRIRGSAGSGKTIVLVGRAVEAASEGRRVLIVTFNRTLVGLLNNLVEEYAEITEQHEARSRIDIHHFHGWCKDIHEKYHKPRPKPPLPEAPPSDWDSYNALLAKSTQEILQGHIDKNLGMYDTVLVDEGQDFRLDWWQCLCALIPDGVDEIGWSRGEMMLVADIAQDLYGTATAWTEQAMNGAGFRGDWFILDASYRMPPALVPLVTRFIDEYLPKSNGMNRPCASTSDIKKFPFEWRWHELNDQDGIERIVQEIRRLSPIQEGRAIVVQVPSKKGLEVVRALRDAGFDPRHIFDREGPNTKDGFTLNSGEIGVITSHSFKGLEAPFVLLWIDRFNRPDKRFAAYVGMTRVKRHAAGSELVVLNQASELSRLPHAWRSLGPKREHRDSDIF